MRAGAFDAPRPVAPGATLGLFAPSGAIHPDRLDKAVARLEALGHGVVVAPESHAPWRYFAGTDEARLAAFHRLLADPAVDALMMIRGGYGWSRLLHRVDWDLVARARKPLVGFSDFTALNLGALARSRLVTFAGPGAAIDFGGIDDPAGVQADHAFMEAHCWPALAQSGVTAGPVESAHDHRAQVIDGTLWGSNLSLVANLVGTPYFPAIDGGILFLEEVDEQPYAIERDLMQLFHAGVLARQRAILLGDFSDCEPDTAGGRFPYSLAHVIETLRGLVDVPVLTGLPFGHVARKLTLPVGATATLDIAPGRFTLAY